MAFDDKNLFVAWIQEAWSVARYLFSLNICSISDLKALESVILMLRMAWCFYHYVG